MHRGFNEGGRLSMSHGLGCYQRESSPTIGSFLDYYSLFSTLGSVRHVCATLGSFLLTVSFQ